MNRIRRFFARTEDGARFRRRAMPYLGLAGFFVVVLLAVPPAWEFSNSTQFCGETCHTMPPEYQTYLVSPHARVPCVDCHIGRGLIIEQAVRKTGHMRLLWDTITNSYEYPIFVSSMRPARDTCELCHFPEKFSNDSLVEIQRYRQNEENTPYNLYLLMHTGGGSAREGLGRGIHWHIENEIEYVASDALDQDIPWVRVTYTDGSTEVYTTEDSTVDAADLETYDVKTVDCMTCHNRISHLIEPPRDLVDAALARGDLSTSIPNIRYEAETVLAMPYESTPEAHDGIDNLIAYYAATYPDFYQANESLVEESAALLKTIWDANNYVEQELSWETHPNNVGHRDWPGCFRCHDGQHFSEGGEAIRLECNLCHSIPQVVKPTDIEPTLPLATGLEPESHLDSTWISRHHNEFDRSCANCHTVENPGGTSDTSFCSNSACHGTNWRFAGFDAPSLALELGLIQTIPGEAELPALPEELTYQEIQPILAAECSECHGDNPTAGLKVTDYASLMAGGRDGAVITPGDADASLIFQVLGEGHFGALTTAQLELVRQWVAEGAPEGSPPQAVAEGPVTYETLQPVLEAMCGECHGTDSPRAGLTLTTYEGIMAGNRGGPVIEPGDLENSYILEVLGEGHFAELTDEQMQQLREWITEGAPATPADLAPAATEEAPVSAESSGGLDYQTLQPMIEAACGECHGTDEPRASLTLTTYEGLMAGNRGGPVIEPGDPANSYILEVQSEEHHANFTPEQMQLLTDWIAAGAPEFASGDSAPAATEEAPAAGSASASAGALTFTATIQPMLEAKCGECHGADEPRASLTLTTYEGIMAGNRGGPVIEPGDPANSYILEVQSEEHHANLSPEEMQTLTDWIAAGAPE